MPVAHGKRQRKVASKLDDGEVQKRAEKVLAEERYEPTDWFRVLPDAGPDEPTEVIFRGKWKGRHGGEPDTEPQCYTVHIWPDGSGFVTEGWS
jgi:hypothetical protein